MQNCLRTSYDAGRAARVQFVMEVFGGSSGNRKWRTPLFQDGVDRFQSSQEIDPQLLLWLQNS